MATLNIVGNVITQTAAQWAADFTVYTNRQMLVTSDVFYAGTDQPRFSFGNGTDVWLALDYVPIADNTEAYKFSHTSGNALADGADYFISTGTVMGNTVNSSTPMVLPTCTVVEAFIETYNGSTFGTTETFTFTLVDEANVTIGVLSTVVTFDARNRFFPETLNIPVTEGPVFIRVDTPIMATNPTAAKVAIILRVEI